MKDTDKKKLNIGTIGHTDFSKTTFLRSVGDADVGKGGIVDIKQQYSLVESNTIVINGVVYRKVDDDNPSHLLKTARGFGKQAALSKHYAMMSLLSGCLMYGNTSRFPDLMGKSRKLPSNINIEEEFALIQEKKSKLSKWERDAVVGLFLRMYNEVK